MLFELIGFLLQDNLTTKHAFCFVAGFGEDLLRELLLHIPHWPGFPEEKRETIYWYEKGRGTMGSGFFAETFTHVGQWGTHVDPPAHFVKGLRTVDQIDLKEMILPLVVVDVHNEVENNLDYTQM